MTKYEYLKANEAIIKDFIDKGLISFFVTRNIMIYLKMKSLMAAGMNKTNAAMNCENIYRDKDIKITRILKIYNELEKEV